MSLTYTWKITGLKKTSDGTVVQTYWQKIGTDENGNTGKFAGATPFKRDPLADFVPFEELTEETVIGWIKDVVVGQYETHVNEQIEKELNASLVKDARMPWDPEEPTPASTAPDQSDQ